MPLQCLEGQFQHEMFSNNAQCKFQNCFIVLCRGGGEEVLLQTYSCLYEGKILTSFLLGFLDINYNLDISYNYNGFVALERWTIPLGLRY